MNVRIIDPGNHSAVDDRFSLLMDLKYLASAYLDEAMATAGGEVLSAVMTETVVRRAQAVRASIRSLRSAGDEIGLPADALPRIDLAAGFAAIARDSGADGFNPMADGAALLTGALLVNSLGLAVIAALLMEGDAARWRSVLLPVFADDCRFEGCLKGALAGLGEAADSRAAELLVLASGPVAFGSSRDRLWSFDLLRMAVSRLACGGSRSRRGGFFPDGMSGS